jgi:hypothetical protein
MLISVEDVYQFGMVVNAVSDIYKRREWDRSIADVQVLQKFATNGFLYHTVYHSASKVTPAEDFLEK